MAAFIAIASLAVQLTPQSYDELIAGAEPTISQYDGTSLSQVAERFRRLDSAYLADASARVHAAADETRVATMKLYPDTSRAACSHAARSRSSDRQAAGSPRPSRPRPATP